ncbi:tyrosine-type recombinase/integrase [Desulforegula conservatrix]|uniref:tyrosine-type recombinase/integrase n=1 Tax=Desulforegula conservatrix TaxID=153026 RepID=UPI000413A115|nr:tyrosine-type recombinase/integrase [Desulforegula conservatrix]
MAATISNNNRSTERQIRNIDGIKYFNTQQIKLLRRTVMEKALLASGKDNVTAIKEWMAVDLITSTGIRVSEAANLRCGDIMAGYGESAIFIRNGKGSRSRTVQISEALKKHLKRFLSWKQLHEEEVSEDSFIFIGQRGPWTRQAIQQLLKKYLKQLGIYEKGKSVHSLRHSYATELYRKKKDLRAVQKQLGHSSITTTQIYADITQEDLQAQINGMWGGCN